MPGAQKKPTSLQQETIMRLSMIPSFAAALALAWLLSLPTNAQVGSPQGQSPQAQPAAPPAPSDQSSDISDQKLDATVAAMQRVASLKQDYQQRIVTAPETDKRRIADEAVGALTKAVTDQGLTVEEYTSILEVAQNDPAVFDKIRQRLRPSDK
jgi:Domain of unknown function (DUF4168)